MNIKKIAPKNSCDLTTPINSNLFPLHISKIINEISENDSEEKISRTLATYKDLTIQDSILKLIFSNFGWNENTEKFSKQINLKILVDKFQKEYLPNTFEKTPNPQNNKKCFLSTISQKDSLSPENDIQKNLQENSQNLNKENTPIKKIFDYNKNINNSNINYLITEDLSFSNFSILNSETKKLKENLINRTNEADILIHQTIKSDISKSKKRLFSDFENCQGLQALEQTEVNKNILYSNKKSSYHPDDYSLEYDDDTTSIKKPIPTTINNTLEFSKISYNNENLNDPNSIFKPFHTPEENYSSSNPYKSNVYLNTNNFNVSGIQGKYNKFSTFPPSVNNINININTEDSLNNIIINNNNINSNIFNSNFNNVMYNNSNTNIFSKSNFTKGFNNTNIFNNNFNQYGHNSNFNNIKNMKLNSSPKFKINNNFENNILKNDLNNINYHINNRKFSYMNIDEKRFPYSLKVIDEKESRIENTKNNSKYKKIKSLKIQKFSQKFIKNISNPDKNNNKLNPNIYPVLEYNKKSNFTLIVNKTALLGKKTSQPLINETDINISINNKNNWMEGEINHNNTRKKRNILKNRKFLDEENYFYEKSCKKSNLSNKLNFQLANNLQKTKNTKIKKKFIKTKEENENILILNLNDKVDQIKRNRKTSKFSSIKISKPQQSIRNTSYGLKEISKSVLKIVRKLKSTTYKEISDLIVNDINHDLNSTKDEKNIRRRIYDSLNVMKAMNLFKKDKNLKNIIWNSKNSIILNNLFETEEDNKNSRNNYNYYKKSFENEEFSDSKNKLNFSYNNPEKNDQKLTNENNDSENLYLSAHKNNSSYFNTNKLSNLPSTNLESNNYFNNENNLNNFQFVSNFTEEWNNGYYDEIKSKNIMLEKYKDRAVIFLVLIFR